MIIAWKCKGLSNGSIKLPATWDNSFNPRLDYLNTAKFRMQFNGSCLRHDKVIFTPDKIINLHTTFELKSWPFYIHDGFMVRNFLFGTVKLTKNAGPDKYSYSGYDILFDVPGTFSLPNGGFGKNVEMFGADMSSSLHVDNKKRIS